MAALLGAAPAVLASSIRDEISVDRTQSTAQNPRAGSVSNLLGANFDVGDDWVVSGTAVVTLEDATPGPVRATFRDTGGTVTAFSLGADWDLTEAAAGRLGMKQAGIVTLGSASLPTRH